MYLVYQRILDGSYSVLADLTLYDTNYIGFMSTILQRECMKPFSVSCGHDDYPIITVYNSLYVTLIPFVHEF